MLFVATGPTENLRYKGAIRYTEQKIIECIVYFK
jgi:hypothetical protein